MLGAVKGIPAVLSGEMRDTVQLNQGIQYINRHSTVLTRSKQSLYMD